jgi:hypothetical protein
MAEPNADSKETPKLKYVTYCGLYCRLCANMARIPKQARALRETLTKEGYEHFGKDEIEGFEPFWKALERFGQMDKTCAGCRSGECGDPRCEIRKCAKAKGVEVCSACPDFPCKHIEGLAERYPTLIADAKRQRKVGLDRWIQEQEDRIKTGFSYADIRL